MTFKAVLLLVTVISFAQGAAAGDSPSLKTDSIVENQISLFASLKQPGSKNQELLISKLEKEGFTASPGDSVDEVVITGTEKQLLRIFGCRIVYKTVAANARDRMVTEPFIEGYAIPKRFKRLIAALYFDPQRR
jgi:hypothetical protein